MCISYRGCQSVVNQRFKDMHLTLRTTRSQKVCLSRNLEAGTAARVGDLPGLQPVALCCYIH